MSSITNVIQTEFRARGSQAIATLGSVGQGFSNVGRVINENTKLSDRLNSQWRALGTTIRYSLAGGAIFGLTRLVGQLKEVQQQAGLISAIGQQPGGLFGTALTNTQVTRMMTGLRNGAVQALTPVQQMNDAATNFLSTVQNVEPAQVPAIITAVGQAAKLAQTPVDTLTKSVTTMNVAFGRKNNLQNIQAFNRMWFGLISTAPGGVTAGNEIANQLPQLASMFQLGRGRGVSAAQGQAQMLSLTLGALRTGATPSTGMRGLTYLLQSIAQPTGGAGKALSGIGITPQFVEQKGIYAAVLKLLNQISTPSRGTVNKLKGMSDEQIDELDSSGGNLPGISAAEMGRLRKMVPRIHGIRAAIILASQLQQHGDVSSLQQDLALMMAEQNNQVQGALNMAQAWQRFRNRAKLQEAVTAIDAMRLQVATIFEPVINFAARHTTGLQKAMAHHPKATRDIAIGGAGFLAAMGIGRVFGAGRLPYVGRLFGGANLGAAFERTNAIQAAMHGGVILGDSPQNPMYVTVVGPPLFGSGANSPGPTGNRPGSNIAEDYVGYRLARRAGSLFSRWGKKALGLGEKGGPKFANYLGEDAGMFSKVGGRALGPAGVLFDYFYNASNAGSKGEANWQGNISMLHRRFGNNVFQYENPKAMRINGQASVALTLDLTGPGGVTVRKRVHVPLNLWKGGSTPSSGGRPATRRN